MDMAIVNKVFIKLLKKHGWDNFKHEILFENLSEKEAKNKEIELICEHNTKTPNGYNITEGGDGSVGYKATLQTREKLSKSHLGQKAWNKGIKPSPETLEKLKQSHKRLWKDKEHQERMSKAHMGVAHTKETIDKISKKQRKKKKSCSNRPSKKRSCKRMGHHKRSNKRRIRQ